MVCCSPTWTMENTLAAGFTDAVTGGPVDDDTTLVALVNPKKKDPEWNRIKPVFQHTAWIKAKNEYKPHLKNPKFIHDWDGINLKWSVAL